MGKYCTKCGSQLDNDGYCQKCQPVRFCIKCGKPLDRVTGKCLNCNNQNKQQNSNQGSNNYVKDGKAAEKKSPKKSMWVIIGIAVLALIVLIIAFTGGFAGQSNKIVGSWLYEDDLYVFNNDYTFIIVDKDDLNGSASLLGTDTGTYMLSEDEKTLTIKLRLSESVTYDMEINGKTMVLKKTYDTIELTKQDPIHKSFNLKSKLLKNAWSDNEGGTYTFNEDGTYYVEGKGSYNKQGEYIISGEDEYLTIKRDSYEPETRLITQSGDNLLWGNTVFTKK